MKRISTMVVFAMVIFLVACDSKIIDGPTVTSLDTEKKELVIWHTFSEEETEVFENTILPEFEKKFTNIDVSAVRQTSNQQLKTALISRMSAHKPPDIVRMDINWVPQFAKLNLIYPVSDLEGFQEINELLYESPQLTNFYNGKYYGISLNTNTKVAIYSKELLLGTDSEPPETLEEIFNIAEENGYVIGIDSLNPWDTLHYFYGLGGMVTDPTYTNSLGYFDSAESIKAVKRLLELYKNGVISPQLIEGSTNKWEGVISDKYLMIDEGPWFYSVNSEEQIAFILEETISTPFPITNGKRAVSGGENLVISKDTEHLEEAWTFLKWMVSEMPQTEIAKTGLIPANKFVNRTGLYDDYPYYQAYLQGIDQALNRPPIGNWYLIEEIYIDTFEAIFTGKIAVEDGLRNAAVHIDEILAEEKGSLNERKFK